MNKNEELLIAEVCSFFGRIYDDAEEARALKLRGLRPDSKKWNEIMQGRPTLNETAQKFNLPTAKIRKLLIAGGKYNTAMYRKINELHKAGLTVEEISLQLGKSINTVKSYLNYEKVIYNLPERSKNALRIQRFKNRHLTDKKSNL